MTTELKQLPSKPQPVPPGPYQLINRIGFMVGFRVGLGFWAAAFVFSVIIVPVITCVLLATLTALGVSIGGLAAP